MCQAGKQQFKVKFWIGVPLRTIWHNMTCVQNYPTLLHSAQCTLSSSLATGHTTPKNPLSTQASMTGRASFQYRVSYAGVFKGAVSRDFPPPIFPPQLTILPCAPDWHVKVFSNMTSNSPRYSHQKIISLDNQLLKLISVVTVWQWSPTYFLLNDFPFKSYQRSWLREI